MHIDYDAITTDYDVALIELDRPVRFGERVRPVCMPEEEEAEETEEEDYYAGRAATVSGWGDTTSGGAGSDVLREVTVRVVAQAECRRRYGGEEQVTDRMLCAGDRRGGRDACQGDSGGPLVLRVRQHLLSIYIIFY